MPGKKKPIPDIVIISNQSPFIKTTSSGILEYKYSIEFPVRDVPNLEWYSPIDIPRGSLLYQISLFRVMLHNSRSPWATHVLQEFIAFHDHHASMRKSFIANEHFFSEVGKWITKQRNSTRLELVGTGSFCDICESVTQSTIGVIGKHKCARIEIFEIHVEYLRVLNAITQRVCLSHSASPDTNVLLLLSLYDGPNVPWNDNGAFIFKQICICAQQ
jgi:hypothetical protein